MLNLELHLTNEARQRTTLSGTIRNTGTLQSPRLHCELERGDGASKLVGTCQASPWETPLVSLLVSALTAALSRDRGRRIDVRKQMGEAEVVVLAAGQPLLSRTCFRVYDDIIDSDGEWERLGRASVAPWKLAVHMLLRAGAARCCSQVRAAKPQVYWDGKQSYCRVIDLPKLLRGKFEQAHCLRPQPVVKGVTDAVFPAEMARFLALHSWTLPPEPGHGSGAFPDPSLHKVRRSINERTSL
jgi:hypothetical protein